MASSPLYEECGRCPTSPPKPEFCERSYLEQTWACDCRCHIDAAEAVMRSMEARAKPMEEARKRRRRDEVIKVYVGSPAPSFDSHGRAWTPARRRRQRWNLAEAIAGAPMLVAGLAIATLPLWAWPWAILGAQVSDWMLRRRARRRAEGDRGLPPARVKYYSGKLKRSGSYDVRAFVEAHPADAFRVAHDRGTSYSAARELMVTCSKEGHELRERPDGIWSCQRCGYQSLMGVRW